MKRFKATHEPEPLVLRLTDEQIELLREAVGLAVIYAETKLASLEELEDPNPVDEIHGVKMRDKVKALSALHGLINKQLPTKAGQ